MRIRFTASADRQIARAFEWWRKNRDKAPQVLAHELSRALDLIGSQPTLGEPARHVRFRSVRRVTLHRVRYHLYYRIVNAQDPFVEVIAFWHASRNSPFVKEQDPVYAIAC